MPLTYSQAIKEFKLSQMLSIIRFEDRFQWADASLKCIESENNKRFDIYVSKDLSNKKTKDWTYVETLIAEDKYEAKRFRRYKRYTEHNYAVIVNYEEDGEQKVRVHYLWDDKNEKVAKISLYSKVVEDWFTFKGFEDIDELGSYIKTRDSQLEEEFQNRRQAMKLQQDLQMKRSQGIINWNDIMKGNNS